MMVMEMEDTTTPIMAVMDTTTATTTGDTITTTDIMEVVTIRVITAVLVTGSVQVVRNAATSMDRTHVPSQTITDDSLCVFSC